MDIVLISTRYTAKNGFAQPQDSPVVGLSRYLQISKIVAPVYTPTSSN